LINQALEIARQKRFFHWKLEFPEVWYTERGPRENPGFDAVVGNPPYGAELSEDEDRFIKKSFDFCKRNSDTALAFIERSFTITGNDHFCGLIVPKSLAYVESWQALRPLYLPYLRILGDASKAFEDVLLEQIVIITGQAQQYNYQAISLSAAATRFETIIPKADCERIGRLLCDVSTSDRHIFEKVETCSVEFENLFESFEGGHWYSDLKPAGKIPVYHGKRLQRYFLLPPSDYLDTPPTNDVRKFEKMRSSKLLFQRLVAHIMNPRPHIKIACYYDDSGIIPLKTIEVCIPRDTSYKPTYSLALCNSQLLSYFAYKFIFASAIRGMDFDAAYVGRLPIRRIFFTTAAEERARLVEQLKELYSKILEKSEVAKS
jgi:hypothetical protein